MGPVLLLCAGCTKQACTFQNNIKAFKDMDVAVFGVSGQDQESKLVREEQARLGGRGSECVFILCAVCRNSSPSLG